jgi:hypothetical protein
VGEVFSLQGCILSQLLFLLKTAWKIVRVIGAANLQLDLPIFLLSCRNCPKEWEDLVSDGGKSAEVGGVPIIFVMPISYSPR